VLGPCESYETKRAARKLTLELWKPAGLALLLTLRPLLLPDLPRETDLGLDLDRGVPDLERALSGVRERLREQGEPDLPRASGEW
jgi:hypothetical protein